MLRVLLDENISPALVVQLWDANIDAVPVRNRGMLEASDIDLWRFAAGEARAIVTINAGDFEAFAEHETTHPGIIVIPSGGTREEQLTYVLSVGVWISRDGHRSTPRDHIVEIRKDGSIIATEFRLRPSQDIEVVRISNSS